MQCEIIPDMFGKSCTSRREEWTDGSDGGCQTCHSGLYVALRLDFPFKTSPRTMCVTALLSYQRRRRKGKRTN